MKPTLFNKLFVALTLFLTLFYAVWFGADIATGNSKEAIADGVLAAFWLFAFWFFSVMNRKTEKLDREFEQSSKELDKAMDDLLGHLKEESEKKKRVHDAMHEAFETIGADRPPKPSEYKKVQDKFHEVSGGLYLQLTAVKGDKRPSAKVSDKPFTAVKSKKAPAKKPVTKKGAANVKPTKARK